MAKKKKSKFGKIIIILLLLVIAAGAGGFVYYNNGLKAVTNEPADDVIISIGEGDYVGKVLDKMDEAGLIKNKLAAKVYARLHKVVLKHNNYHLNPSMSLPELLNIMEKGDTHYIVYSKMTIPEGSRLPAVAKKVASTLGVKTSKVLDKWSDKTYLKKLAKDFDIINYKTITQKDIMYPLEGYFYPETYYLESNPTLDSLTRQMLGQTQKVLKPYLSKTKFSAHELLSLTSVVEQETLFDKDLPKIAGVFMNRLNDDMPLQSDITVNYALQRTGVDVTTAMTKTDSKYNTYKYRGLPIGPVGACSKKAIDATVNYKKHSYYYFFATKDGEVIYSKTYKQHQKAINENKWY